MKKYNFHSQVAENKSLMEEWDFEKNKGIIPTEITCGMNMKVWWKCKTCGHSYQDRIDLKAKGKKCPYCNKKRIIPGFNDIKTLYPDVAKEWMYDKNQEFDIEKLTPGSDKKVWWKCSKCGHEWQARIFKRTLYHQGCQLCALKKVSQDARDDKIVKYGGIAHDMVVMDDWDYEKNKGIDPYGVCRFSMMKVWWKCHECGHEWQARIQDRSKGSGCPICARKRKPLPIVTQNVPDKK